VTNDYLLITVQFVGKKTVKSLCLTHQNQIPSYCAKIIFTKVEGE